MLKNLVALPLFLVAFFFSKAQRIDVLQYNFHLQLTDASDTVKGTARITFKFLENTRSFHFDLASVSHGKGMQVLGVTAGDTTFSFTHVHDTLAVALPYEAQKETVQTFVVSYAGIPADGLIISKNKWGDRTFFADNWPNRAHQWLPCNDRPDDKALVEFGITAPAHYKIISNGILTAEKDTGSHLRFTHWKESVAIPTKVMVIGAARFAVKDYEDSSVAPISAWVYPQDSAKGFYDYALAPPIVTFFSSYIGPYAFEKLANVQSTTIFGGMENASAIFYGETTVTGNRQSEALLAHEIAHQWFGNSATEERFAHLWLSEGFATYLTHLYLEQKYGRDTLVKRLQEDRREIIRFAEQNAKPVVDSLSPLMDLLNANSYQKGGWVLHMLRGQVGDTLFKNIIQAYYRQYKLGNADTWAFEKVAEDVSGKDLKAFFTQWLYTPGLPQLQVRWKWKKGQLVVSIHQKQKKAFAFPLTIGVYDEAGTLMQHPLKISHAMDTCIIPSVKKPARVTLDPGTNLLFNGTISEQQSP